MGGCLPTNRGKMNTAYQAIPRTYLLGTFDTLKYLVKGGRIGKARALLGAALIVKSLITMREGELHPAGLARTRAKAIEKSYEFTRNTSHIEDMAIVHSTTPKEAEMLAERVKSFVKKGQLYIPTLGPALGAHGGPGALIVALRVSD